MERTTRLRRALAMVAVGMLFGLTGVASVRAERPREAEKDPALQDLKPLEPEKGDDELRKLLAGPLQLATLTVLKVRQAEFENGRVALDTLHLATKMVLDARLEVTSKPEERMAILTAA